MTVVCWLGAFYNIYRKKLHWVWRNMKKSSAPECICIIYGHLIAFRFWVAHISFEETWEIFRWLSLMVWTYLEYFFNFAVYLVWVDKIKILDIIKHRRFLKWFRFSWLLNTDTSRLWNLGLYRKVKLLVALWWHYSISFSRNLHGC